MKKAFAFVATAILSSYALWGEGDNARTASSIMRDYAKSPQKERVQFLKSLSANDWRMLGDYTVEVAATNQTAVNYFPIKVWELFCSPTFREDMKNLTKEYDSKLSAVGFMLNQYFYPTFPLCTENYFAATNGVAGEWSTTHPVMISLIRKYGRTIDSNFYNQKLTFAECANILEEYASSKPNYSIVGFTLRSGKHILLTKASPLARRYLRSQGKTFVAKSSNDVNPIQSDIDALAAILDAPRMEGLREWVVSHNPSYNWVPVKWMDDDEFNKLQNAIMFGDIPITPERRRILCAYLGVADFNVFVKEYNGDK